MRLCCLAFGTSFVTSDVGDWTLKIMPAPECIICHEEHKDSCPNDAAPIHVMRSWVWCSWKELEDPEYNEKAQRDHINRIAGSPKMKS